LDQTVAVKVLKPLLMTDPDFVNRFKQEAKLAANLQHSHLVRIFNFVEHEGRLGIVSDFLPQGDLKERMSEAALSLDEIPSILEQVGQALDYMHREGMVHRDVKPSNILFNAEGQAVLTDFGIAKALQGTHTGGDSGGTSYAHTTGGSVGTPAYMAPEQIMGDEVDGRADVYALGIVAYEMITGTVPFRGPTTKIHHSHVYEPPPALTTQLPTVPPALSAVVLRALEKDPERRYATAGDFAQALREAVVRAKDAWLANQLAVIDERVAQEDLDLAIERLVLLLRFFPHREDVAEKLETVRHLKQFDKHYAEVRKAWLDAKARAESLTALVPDAPDPEHILERLLNAQADTRAEEQPERPVAATDVPAWIPTVAVVTVILTAIIQIFLRSTYGDHRNLSTLASLYRPSTYAVLALPALAAALIRWWPGPRSGRRWLAWLTLGFRLFALHTASNLLLRPTYSMRAFNPLQGSWAALDLLSVLALGALLWSLVPHRRKPAASALSAFGALSVVVSFIFAWENSPLKIYMGYDLLDGAELVWWMQNGLVLLPALALFSNLLLCPRPDSSPPSAAGWRAIVGMGLGGLALVSVAGMALIIVTGTSHLLGRSVDSYIDEPALGLWILIEGLATLWIGTTMHALRVLREIKTD
jgi:serine/threonine-protein kinase